MPNWPTQRIVGPTGSGKSTVWSLVLDDVLLLMIYTSAQFIATASGTKDHSAIGHGLQTVTTDIRSVKANHPEDCHAVVFLDTPDFDDSPQSGTKVLLQIDDWLKT